MRFKLPWTVCRACLREGQMYSIFEKDSIGMTVAEKVTLVTDVKIVPDKNYPQEICRQCLILLNTAYEFQIRCRKSEFLLKMCMKQKTHTEQGATKSVALTMSNGKIFLMPKDITVRTGSAVINPGINQARSRQQTKNHNNTEDNAIKLRPYSKGANPISTKNLVANIGKNPNPGSVKLEANIDDHFEEDSLHHDSDNEVIDLSNSEHKVEILADIALEQLSREKLMPGKCSENIDNEKSKTSNTCNNLNTVKENPIKNRATTCKKEITGTSAVKMYICELCGNKYKGKAGFDLHLRIHRNERPFECEICHSKFFQHSKLTIHMRRHTGERPFSCSYCNRKFITKKSKNLHERMHTGEKPYQCNICEKSFSYSFVLARHKLLHTSNEKSFVCEPCDKRFRFRYHLEAHCKTAAHEKSFAMNC